MFYVNVFTCTQMRRRRSKGRVKLDSSLIQRGQPGCIQRYICGSRHLRTNNTISLSENWLAISQVVGNEKVEVHDFIIIFHFKTDKIGHIFCLIKLKKYIQILTSTYLIL